jgi:hypothetical protein
LRLNVRSFIPKGNLFSVIISKIVVALQKHTPKQQLDAFFQNKAPSELG